MFGRLGTGELLLILALVLLIFGPSKLPALAKSMGQAVKEFRKGTREVEEGLQKLANEPAEGHAGGARQKGGGPLLCRDKITESPYSG